MKNLLGVMRILIVRRSCHLYDNRVEYEKIIQDKITAAEKEKDENCSQLWRALDSKEALRMQIMMKKVQTLALVGKEKPLEKRQENILT